MPHLHTIATLHQMLATQLKATHHLVPLLEQKPDTLLFQHLPGATLTQLIETDLLNKRFSHLFKYFDIFLCTLNKLKLITINPYKNKEFVHFFDPNLKFKKNNAILAYSIGLIDLTFSNLLYNDATSPSALTSKISQPFIIDQEWLVAGGIPKNYLIFRSLNDLCIRLQPLIKLYCSPELPCWELTPHFFIPQAWVEYLRLDYREFALFLFWENNWQNHVNMRQSRGSICLINQENTPPIHTHIALPSLGQKNADLQIQIQTLTSQLDQARTRILFTTPIKIHLSDFLTRCRRLFLNPHHYLNLIITQEKLTLKTSGFSEYYRRLSKKMATRSYFNHLQHWSNLAVKATTASADAPTKSSDRSKFNILIINGAAGTVSQIHRVDHLVAKLKILGHKYTIIDHQCLPQLRHYDLNEFNCLFIHRATAEPLIEQLCDSFHHHQLPVIFDIDDLVFDPHIVSQISAAQNLTPAALSIFTSTIIKHRQLLMRADLITCSTSYLATYLHNQFPSLSVTTLPNHLDQDSFLTGQKIASHKLQNSNFSSISTDATSSFTLGYFPGTKTHDQDFAVCTSALVTFLTNFPHVKLKIVGELTLPAELARFQGTSQLTMLPLVPYEKLIMQYQDVDLNLVPLEENAFCQAKSELKYFFAGICGIPTLATPTQPYQTALHRSGGGALCSTTSDWLAQMTLFLTQPPIHHRAALAAYQDCLQIYSPSHQAEILANILSTLTTYKN